MRNDEVLQRFKEEMNIIQTIKSRKANWIGHILRRNCLLKHVIGGKIVGKIKVMGRRRGRSKQLLDDLNAKRVCYKLKEETLDRSLWRTRFRKGCGPVVRHNGMSEYSLPLEGVNIFIQCLVTLSNQLLVWLNRVLLFNKLVISYVCFQRVFHVIFAIDDTVDWPSSVRRQHMCIWFNFLII